MNQIEPKIISELSSSMEIDLTSKASNEEVHSALAEHINYLITHDFNKLVAILYRIDINEKLLRTKLETEEKDAGAVIAEMIIERQIQKSQTKQEFRSDDNISGEDKW
jgi:hypothetical protein